MTSIEVLTTAKWSMDVSNALATAKPIPPTFATVEMFRLSKGQEGEEQLSPRPTITKAITAEPQSRPTRFAKQDKLDLDSDEALDAFFRQEDGSGWVTWRDEDAWLALKNWAMRHPAIQPESRRQASRMLGSMLLLRVGVVCSPLELDYQAVA
jgi:hypothetical protein